MECQSNDKIEKLCTDFKTFFNDRIICLLYYGSNAYNRDIYYQLLKDTNIVLDNAWIDIKNTDFLVKEIEKLIQLGYITEKEKDINCCECGKVEISSEAIDNLEGKCYRKEGDKIICNECNKEAIRERSKCLVFTVPSEIGANIKVIPIGASKQIFDINKQMEGADIIISRKRKTAYILQLNDDTYNIDVDFVRREKDV